MKTATLPKAACPLILALCLLMPVLAVQAQESYDNVVVLLDASGSMGQRMPGGQTKMEAAKAALKQVLQQVPKNTHIGLLVFSAANLREDWAYPLGPRDETRLMQAIDSPMPGNNTPLGLYIKKATDRLLQERAKQFGYGTFRLLIVTDGEAQDQNLVDRYTPEVVSRGITVDVIGVSMNQRHTLATKVHSYRSANDPSSLKQAIAEVFAEVGGKKGDAADAQAFDLLAPLPKEMAAAMLQALSTSGNYPIGEKPRVQPAPSAPSAPSAPAPAPKAVAPPMAQPTPPPIQHPITTSHRLGRFGMVFVFVVGLIVVSIFVKGLRR